MEKEEIANSMWQTFRPEDLDNLNATTTVESMSRNNAQDVCTLNTSMLQDDRITQEATLKSYSIETLLSLKDHYKHIPNSNSDELGALASRLIKSYSPTRTYTQMRVHENLCEPGEYRNRVQFKRIANQDQPETCTDQIEQKQDTLNANIGTSFSKHASYSQD